MNEPAGAPSWERVRAAFHAALDMPSEARETWLAQHCADDAALLDEVRRLLGAHARSTGLLDGDAGQFVAELMEPAEAAADARLGSTFGAYRLLQLVGAGGMGSVYLAERTDGQFQHRVALKLMHEGVPTPELRARFLRERDILARLHHSYIAPLLDGGVGEGGTPYFTLELIEGEAITRWCDARAADLAARVRLLLKVCEAVQYAHRNLIVHRDLKPSNILVTAGGAPKLLDFGIAKLLDEAPTGGAMPLTGTQARPMTREYAAPEQVLAQPITTATDVYALGVLLYELLCGRLPYRQAASGATSWPKAIVEEVPEPLSRALTRQDAQSAADLAQCRGTAPATLQRALRGDLERIVRRALEKSPEARYRAVADFADDLQAWFERRPVSGGGWRYRAGKFARRHWLPLVAAAAVGFALVAGAVGVVWQARATAREARTTAEVKDFLVNLFGAVDPHEAKGQDIRARDLVDRGAQRIERELGDQPALKGELQAVLGRIYYQLGLYAQSSALQEKAIAALQRDGSRPLLLARTRVEQVSTLSEAGDYDHAFETATIAAKSLAALPDAVPMDRMNLLIAQARLEISRHHFEAAAGYGKAALELARREQVDRAALAQALLIAGNCEWGTHALDAAEAHYREALDLLSGAGDDDAQVLKTRINLALVLRGQSRFAEALKLTQQQVDGQRKLMGPEHPTTLRALRDLGLTQYHLGHYPEARAAIEEALAGQRKQLGADNPEVAGTLVNLGLVLTDSGDLPGAEKAFTEALDIWQKRYGREHAGVVTALGDLGYLHSLQNRLDQAESELREARELDKKLGGEENAWDRYRLGEVLRLRGKTTEAVTLDRDAVERSVKAFGEANRFTALSHYFLGLALRDADDEAGAIGQLRAALASFAGYLPGADHPLAASVRLELAPLLARKPATREEGLKLADEAVTEREKFLGAGEPRTLAARARRDALRQL